MNLEKALNRINWRFTNKTISPNETDHEAVKFLNDWITRQKEITLKKNILFAKLFCYTFKNEIQFYKNPKQAQRKLYEELEYPIDFHYESVLQILNDVEEQKFCKEKGFPDKHPSKLTDLEKVHRKELITKYEKELLQLSIKGKWDIKTVTKSLNNTITELLNRFPKEV